MKLANLWIIVPTLFFCGLLVARGDGPAPEGNWKPLPEFTDEFDGKVLDTTKWHPNDPGWIGRAPVFFDPSCVCVQDGKLILTANSKDTANKATKLPADFTHTSGFLKSKKPVLYGYFEIKAKVMDSTLVSAFWFYNATPEEWTEIDVFEAPAGIPERRRQYNMNTHLFHSPAYKGTVKKHLTNPKIWTAPEDLAAGFHVYGLEWTKEQIRWSVDGQAVRTEPNEHWHQPLFLCINNESNEGFNALPDDARLPATYEIEYVRAWQQPSAPTTRPSDVGSDDGKQ